MWLRIRFCGLLVVIPGCCALFTLAVRQLQQLSLETWRGLGLPASTGLFLQALLLAAIGYGLWILLGVLCRGILLWAERNERTELVQRMQRHCPALLRGATISALNAGLLIAVPAAPALATPEPAPLLQEDPTSAHNASNEQTTSEVPLPTWIPQQRAIPLNRSLGIPTPRTTERPVAKEVIVQSGDSLWKIAQQQLGASASVHDIATYWPQIHELNRQRIGENPDLLRVGMALLLPTNTR